MNAQDIEEKLARVPVSPAPSEPAMLPPLESLMAEALEFARTQPAGAAEDANHDRLRRAAQVRARLPDIFTNCTPQELIRRVKDRRLVDAARSTSWGGPGFILLGLTGLGKSSAAAWMFRKLLGEGLHRGGEVWYGSERLQWFKAGNLMRARSEYPLGKGDAPEMLAAMSASVLFIDDAGWDRDDPSAVSHILAERYDQGLPTVVTSGLNEQQLIEHYGDAPIRRIVESGGGRCVLVDCFEAP